VDDALFEQLLHEEEGLTLDFKQRQYPFAKAADTDRSELLKDILGFANAPRRSDAYILIGVEDVRGGRANVIGIKPADHLDDHSLQQFVAGLANRPVRFHYAAFGFEGKQVGVIRIDEEQDPPIHLTRDFGKLRKNEVYVRRGSSTDPTRPATPDDIARMGRRSRPGVPQVGVEFAALDSDSALGAEIALDGEFCELPNAAPARRAGGAARGDPPHEPSRHAGAARRRLPRRCPGRQVRRVVDPEPRWR
jgi:hypothetical protein